MSDSEDEFQSADEWESEAAVTKSTVADADKRKKPEANVTSPPIASPSGDSSQHAGIPSEKNTHNQEEVEPSQPSPSQSHKSLNKEEHSTEQDDSSNSTDTSSAARETNDLTEAAGEERLITEMEPIDASESKISQSESDKVEDKSLVACSQQPEIASDGVEFETRKKLSVSDELVEPSTDITSASSVKPDSPTTLAELDLEVSAVGKTEEQTEPSVVVPQAKDIEKEETTALDRPEPDVLVDHNNVGSTEEQAEPIAVVPQAKHVEEEKNVSHLFDKLSKAAETKNKEVVRDSKEEDVLNRLSKAGEQKQQSSGWGSWGSWGSTLLSTATSSINTFTGQVSEGMHTVVDTFEASVGAPSASDLASEISQHVKEPDEKEVIPKSTEQSQKIQEEKQVGETKEAATGAGEVKAEEHSDWFASWGVSGITNQLQSKTKVLVESGLDVLETIGKKTMEQIKETDPGYVKTKGLLRGGSSSLSQALREAKLANERTTSNESSAQSLVNYSTLFDEHKGLLSLEALELLSISATERVGAAEDVSDTCQERLSTLSDTFNAIHYSEEDCSEDSYDFAENIDDVVERIGLPIKLERITEVEQKTRAWLDDCLQRQDAGERIDGGVIHKAAINAFAELTSCAMEIYHKSGVLLSHDLLGDNQVDTESVSSCFVSILKLVSKEITILSHKFNDCLNTAADDSECPDSINPMITDVFLEASNSTSYVRDAFKLLLPIVQRFELSAGKSPAQAEI